MRSTSCDTTGCGASPAPLGWMPPRYAWALLAGGTAAHVLLSPPPVLRAPLLGAAAIVLGLWMAVGSKRRFRRLGLALPPSARPEALLTDGWFGLSRNPMYVGIAAVLGGVGLVLGSVPALLPAPLFVLCVRRWFVPLEELQLERAHGDRWRRYERQVPRWI